MLPSVDDDDNDADDKVDVGRYVVKLWNGSEVDFVKGLKYNETLAGGRHEAAGTTEALGRLYKIRDSSGGGRIV